MSDTAGSQAVAVADPSIDVGAEGFISSIDAAFEGLNSPEEMDVNIPDVEGDDSQEAPVHQPQDGEEFDPLDEIDVDGEVKDWSPEAARAFKEVRNDLKSERQASRELRETLEQRESRIAELEALTQNPELDTLRQRLEEYESKLLVTKLEDTQAYKDLVEAPLKSILSESDAIAEKYGVDADELFDAIASDDDAEQEEKISELLASASERDRFKAYQLIEQLKPVKHQQSALRENSAEAFQEAQELDQLRQQEYLRSRAESRKLAAHQVASRLTEKLTFLPKIEGLDMDQVIREVEAADPSSMSPVNAAYNQMAASIFPKIAREYVKMMKENESLVSKLAAYASSSPRVGNSMGARSEAADGASFVDAVARAFGG
jgi:hypothetical protein